MTRIIAGIHRGRRIETPPGDRTRPTSDRVRESLFGSLQAMVDLDGAAVLDLYAGSGAVGLEAASRGASPVVLIESHAKTVGLLRRNIATLGLGARVSVTAGAIPQVLRQRPPRRFDVVFADPPYALDNAALATTLSTLVEFDWLAEEADVIVERATRGGAPDWPEGIEGLRSRRYGESTLWYGRGLWTQR
ncbi:16S rRNA (guanine(966)-N(2))-methyltransferase RsmD [Stackebrandtia soli]|uniref:16S rRNA (guanine(966)-N(2))-methyltransferase RsmD n=1 Tax=Stackebrandtia soli TaxID=1892856 RepID=UPI0039EB32B1